MKMKVFVLLLSLLGSVLPSLAQTSQPDLLTLNNWRMHPGDNLAWAAPAFDDSEWPIGALSRGDFVNWVAGYRWYRTSVTLPTVLQNRDLAIGIGPLDDVYEVYVQGVSIGRFGQWLPHPDSTFDRNLSFFIPARLTSGPTLHIAIRRWNANTTTAYFPFYTSGAVRFRYPVSLGTPENIAARTDLAAYQGIVRNIPWNLGLLGLFFAGCVALVLYSAQRDHLEYLFLGLYGVLGFLSPLAGALLAANDHVSRHSLAAALVLAVFVFCSVLSLLVLAELCRRFRKVLYFGAALIFALDLIGIFGLAAQNPIAHFTSAYGFYVSAVFDLIAAWGLIRERDPGSLAIAVALILNDLSAAWTNSFSHILGVSDLRFMPVGPVLVDIRSIFSDLFIFVTLIVLYFRYRKDQFRQVALEQDLASAQRMQQQLLGGNALRVPGFSIDAVYIPAKEVGGDFYRTVALSDGGLLVIVGDVSGKGLDAAMLVASVLGSLANETDRSPASLLTYLNRAVAGRTGGGFVTALCIRFYPGDGIVAANAGHIAPYLNGKEIPLENSLPLGINPDIEYTETVLPIGVATVTMLSDGVLEARSATGELLGFDRLAILTAQPAAEIALAAQRWGQEDDITVLTVSAMSPVPSL